MGRIKGSRKCLECGGCHLPDGPHSTQQRTKRASNPTRAEANKVYHYYKAKRDLVCDRCRSWILANDGMMRNGKRGAKLCCACFDGKMPRKLGN